DSLILAMEELLRRAGENFYFYFAGHGLTSRMDFSNENGIVLDDFTDRLTTKSLTVRSIIEGFQAADFRQQFFFIDACVNIPWEREFRLGEYPNPRSPRTPPPPQFVMYATSPGVKAIEIQEAGNEHGAFTATLLEALAGKGNAKVWDNEMQEYVV